MTKSQHTPTPWIINGRFIDCKQGEMICHFPQSSDIGTDMEDVKEMGVAETRYKSNAALIVKAVNEREGLIEALEAAKDAWERPNPERQIDAHRLICAAIKLAKGE